MKTLPPPAYAAISDEGDFYVEPDCCLLCGVPEGIAPEVFQTGEDYCFVKRQPSSQDEVDRTIRAMWSSEVDCIRYRGHEAALLDRLARAGMTDQADYPHTPDSPPALRDRVIFSMPVGINPPTYASQIANDLRTYLRASGKKVLPPLLGRRTVWVSWIQNQFHRVHLIDDGAGRFVVHLRSGIALQGLAWLVDDWLRATGAEGIRWETTGDPTSASATPM
jgi:hypothetical protein